MRWAAHLCLCLLSACAAPRAPRVAITKEDPPRPRPRTIEEAVSRSRPGWMSCYDQAVAKDKTAAGVVKVLVEVDADGSLLDARAVASSMPPELADCVVAALRTTPFPVPEGGYARWTVPIVLSSVDFALTCMREIEGGERCTAAHLTPQIVAELAKRDLSRTTYVARDGDDLAQLAAVPTLHGVDLRDVRTTAIAVPRTIRKLIPPRDAVDAGPFAQLEALESLELYDTRITSLEPLRAHGSLRELVTPHGAADLDPVGTLAGLKVLYVGAAPSSWSFASKLTTLTELGGPCPKAPELAPLSSSTLRELTLRSCEHLGSLVGTPPTIETVRLGKTSLVNLTGLAGARLRKLDVHGSKSLRDIAALAKTTTLEEVDLTGTSVIDLWPLLASVSTLRWLGVPRSTPSEAVDALRAKNPALVVRRGD